VSARHGEERVALDRSSIQWLEGDVGEHEEVPLGSVEHIRDTAAVAIAGERHETFDAVPRSLHADALLAVIHALRALTWGLGWCCRREAHAIIIA
jgi:hypothetical protein